MSSDPVIDFLRAGFAASPLMRELAGDAQRDPYPESEAKRHHVVPRFLLRRFVQPQRDRERIMQLDTKSGQTRWVDPARAASRSRFYRLTDDDGTVHQRVEHFLGRVENHAAPAIERLCAAPEDLTAADRATISYFLALLESRTPAGLEKLADWVDLTVQTMQASSCADPDEFAREYHRIVGKAAPGEIERFRAEMLGMLEDGRIRLANPKEVAVDLMLEVSTTTAQHIYQLHWQLLTAPNRGFITSDRGLAMFDPTPIYPWAGHGIMSSPAAETTIPLDPMRCLLLRPTGEPAVEASVDQQAVDSTAVMAVNLRTYGFGSTYVFAETQDAAVAVRREAKAHPRRVERPRPSPQVILIDAEPGDDRLAEEHRRRGWPGQLTVNQVPHDYVVLDPLDRPIERSVDLSKLAKSRAIRRIGNPNVRESFIPIDPRELFDGGRPS